MGEYRAFVSATGGSAGGRCLAFGDGDSWENPGSSQTDRHPVTCVSLDDAQAYVLWLSRTARAKYRLPTEVELDLAAEGSQRGCDVARTGNSGTCPAWSDAAEDQRSSARFWYRASYRNDSRGFRVVRTLGTP